MTPIRDPRALLLENTSLTERLWGRAVGAWLARGKEVWTFANAYKRPLGVIHRMYRSGPWPYVARLRDGAEVNLASNREAWMHAHNVEAPEFRLARIETASDGISVVELALKRTDERVLVRFSKGVGDPGIFLSNEYGDLPVAGRTVVDVGAGAGESAIYFSLEGAERVLAFEPLPAAYDEAVVNVGRNGLTGRIRLVRSAVGAHPGTIHLHRNASAATTRALAEPTGSEAVPVTTLSEIAEEYSLRDASLKIDCEGDEYALILATPPAVLRYFTNLVMEYHYGARKLRTYLEEAGFRVNVRPPAYVPGSPAPGRYAGLLTARRIDAS